MRIRSFVGVLGVAALAACGDGNGSPIDAAAPDAAPADAALEGFTALDVDCPGGPGCASAGDGVLYVGAAAVPYTPTIVETYTDENGDHEWQSDEPYDDVNGNGEFDAFWLFGGGRAATGVTTDVEARALAFRQGDTTVAIVYLDAIGLLLGDIDAIRAHPLLAGDDLDHVIIGATHAHDTPDTIGLWGKNMFTSGRVPSYIDGMITAAAQAVHAAVTSAVPAEMVIAKTLVLDDPTDITSRTLQWNQDIRDPKIFDPTLTVARFVRVDAPTTTIGTLVTWADHPEVAHFSDDPATITAHFPHWTRETIEQGLQTGDLFQLDRDLPGLGGVTVFVQGALGGQIGSIRDTAPLLPDGTPIVTENHAKDEAIGRNLGRRALEILTDDGETVTELPLTVRSAVFNARIDNSAFQTALAIGLLDNHVVVGYDPVEPLGPDNAPWLPLRGTYLQVGPLGLITVPGELHPELWVGGYDGSWSWGWDMLDDTKPNSPNLATAPQAPYLRDLVLGNPGVRFPIIAGLAEDFVGYIVPAYNYVLHPTDPYFSEADGEHYEEVFSLGPLVEQHAVHPLLELAGWGS